MNSLYPESSLISKIEQENLMKLSKKRACSISNHLNASYCLLSIIGKICMYLSQPKCGFLSLNCGRGSSDIMIVFRILSIEVAVLSLFIRTVVTTNAHTN